MLRRQAITALLCALPIGAQAQQQQTPQAFLEGIYQPYRQIDFKGQPYWETGRFFTPDLAQAIERDMREAKRRGEVPALDGDPFIGAQDWEITSLSIASSTAGDKASGAVSFVNLGTPRALALTLVRTPAGWRIADIVGSGGSLRALFKLHQ